MTETDWITRLKGARIAVLGDVMLDHHVHGRVRRVSEEAPVPVVHVQSERFTLGGAANVAANAAALGASARLIGMIGADAAGQGHRQVEKGGDFERLKAAVGEVLGAQAQAK